MVIHIYKYLSINMSMNVCVCMYMYMYEAVGVRADRFLITWIVLHQALAVGEPKWFCSTTLCFPHAHGMAGLF